MGRDGLALYFLEFADEFQIAAHGHLVIQRGLFWQVTDGALAVASVGEHIHAVHQHLACRGRHVAGEDIQRGRFAGAVLAEQTDDLPLGGGEGNIADGFHHAVALGDAFEFDHGIILRSYLPIIAHHAGFCMNKV